METAIAKLARAIETKEQPMSVLCFLEEGIFVWEITTLAKVFLIGQMKWYFFSTHCQQQTQSDIDQLPMPGYCCSYEGIYLM